MHAHSKNTHWPTNTKEKKMDQKHMQICSKLNAISSVQLLSRVWLCDPMDCSTPGFPVHNQLPELALTHVHQVGDAIQPSNPLSSPSPPAYNLSQHQGLFQKVSSSHQVAKVLEFQLQHQSTQWMRNAGLDEAQAVIKIAGRNINNLRYTDDTTLQKKKQRKTDFL